MLHSPQVNQSARLDRHPPPSMNCWTHAAPTMLWTKGKSGNPRGRPRKGRSLADLLRSAGSRRVSPDDPRICREAQGHGHRAHIADLGDSPIWSTSLGTSQQEMGDRVRSLGGTLKDSEIARLGDLAARLSV